MADPRHEELRRLFDRALELPAAGRTAFLESKCRGDTGLKQRLLAMLAAADDENFLAAPTGPKPEPAVNTPLQEGPGTRIGPYKLLQMIGEGGFGVVFMAEQEKPVARKVALKIIKLGMDTRQVVARFEQERQALAMMDHPNIARVLDAGATDSGRPYFVMDLVKGPPIVEYCDKNNLPIDERLELFAQVCGAVQHAHGKGIIHRDLKPSNILIGTQDGKSQAKVIDFGIAKATSSKLTDKTLFTEHQQIIGTLMYMSPEQAEGSLDIDTRTDVYSLGVLLYELLTGSTPFDSKTLHNAMYGELQRLIREVDPPKPSTRLRDSHATLASIAAHRRIEPKRLGTLLRGELDWIVMKALEKDRSRRYETANGLAMDTQRYLAGEAVVAAPPSTTYRLRKFVRRNKGLVAAVAIVAAALSIGVIAFAWQAEVARDERDNAVRAQKAEAGQRMIAEEQRTLAQAQKAEAKARADELKVVADFQAGMLAQIDPTKAGMLLTQDVTAKFAATLAKANVPEAERQSLVESFHGQWSQVNATDAARELIDRTILKPAIATIEKQFKDQPLVDALLRQTLAERYRELGLYDAALPLQERTLATRRRVLGSEHPDTLSSIERMGNLLRVQGKLAEAEPFCREAMQLSRRVLGKEHRDTLGAIGTLGSLLREQGKLAEAEPYYREALDQQRRTLGDEHRETLTSVGNLGLLLMEQGKLAEAEPYYREALEKRRRILGEEHPDTLAATGSLGALLQKRGKLVEAEPLLREAMEKRRRVLGEEHPGTLNSISHVGAVLRDQGKLAEAEPYLREVLEKSRRILGEAHLTTLASISNLGMLLQTQGKMAEAEPFYREAVEKSRRFLGEEHLNTLMCIGNLGVLLQTCGKLAEAEPYHRQALEKRRRVLGEEHPNTLTAISNLGSLLQAQGKLAEAEPYLREALQKRRRLSGEEHPDTLIALLNMSKLLRVQGQLAEAEPCAREALEKSRRVLGDQHPITLHAISGMGALQVAEGNHADAMTLLAPVEARARKAFAGGNRHHLASLLLNLGKARAGLARAATDFAAAEVNLLEANTIYREAPAATPKDIRACTEALIATYAAWDKAEPGKGHDGKAAQWQAQLEAAK